MKKSILISLMVIGAVAAMITAATSASFTDTVTSQNNQFTAGVLDLALTDGTTCDEIAPPYGGPCDVGTVSFTVGTGTQSNLKPGDSISHDFTVKNSGTLGFTYAVTLTPDAGAIWTCSSSAVTKTQSVTASGSDSTANAIPDSTAAQNETVRVTVSMPLAADNTCQGATGKLEVKFVATQS
jgi:predicted ribosomally synthesized peptide with SipW-like signal peptide